MLLSGIVFYQLLLSAQHDKFEFGRAQGRISGLHQAANSLKSHFPRPPVGTEYDILFSVKTTDVVIYEINGEKKIGVFE